MYTNLEIEFKCKIDKETYLKLLKEFYLANYVNKQTNYYFDTLDYKLRNKHITLRIREKEYNVKLTLKTNVSEGILEKHIILDKNDAKKIRFELAKISRARTVPELHFILDGSMEYGDKIDKLLLEISKGENSD